VRHEVTLCAASNQQEVKPEEASQSLEVIPPERKFLLYCRDAQLDRDLERYRLYAQEGLGIVRQ
jgi:hypothetical protein